MSDEPLDLPEPEASADAAGQSALLTGPQADPAHEAYIERLALSAIEDHRAAIEGLSQ